MKVCTKCMVTTINWYQMAFTSLGKVTSYPLDVIYCTPCFVAELKKMRRKNHENVLR